MSAYSLSVFLHVAGALGLFAALGLEQAALGGLRRATRVAQARVWANLLSGLRRLEGPAAAIVLATGFYLVATRWGRHAWIAAGLAGMVLMAAIGGAVVRRRSGAIARAIPDAEGPIPPGLRERIDDPALGLAASLRAAIALGVVFDMSVKPAGPGAFVALGVALLGGVAVALAARGRRESRAGVLETEG